MKFIDLTNQKFGKLTATSINKRTNGKIYWNCKCDFGNEVIVEGRRLRDNFKINYKKCIERPKPSNYKDLTGNMCPKLIFQIVLMLDY